MFAYLHNKISRPVLDEAMNSFVNGETGKLGSIDAYFYRGSMYLSPETKNYNLDQAIADFTEALQLAAGSDSRIGNIFLQRGKAYLSQSKYEHALKDLLHATRYKCSDIDWAYLKCGDLYFNKYELAFAQQAYAKSLNVKPSERAYSKLGEIFFLRGKLLEAKECFEKVIQFNPKSAFAYCQLGKIELHLSSSLAKTHLLKAISLDAKYAEPYLLLGQFYYQARNPVMAVSEFNKSIQLQPEEFLADIFLAKIYTRMKQDGEGKAHLLDTWDNTTSSLTRLYAGIVLNKLTQCKKDLRPVLKTICENNKFSALRTCLLAIAFNELNDNHTALNHCHAFFRDYLPSAIPPYLRTDLITVLTNLEQSEWDLAKPTETKDELLKIIAQLSDPKLKQMTLWQCLFKHTFLGSIFHIKRKKFKHPRISTGRLHAVAKLLKKEVKNSAEIFIDEQTKQALIQDKDLQKDLKKHFRVLYDVLIKFDVFAHATVSQINIFVEKNAREKPTPLNPSPTVPLTHSKSM